MAWKALGIALNRKNAIDTMGRLSFLPQSIRIQFLGCHTHGASWYSVRWEELKAADFELEDKVLVRTGFPIISTHAESSCSFAGSASVRDVRSRKGSEAANGKP